MEDEEEEDVISVSDPENLKPPSVPTKKRKTDDEILVLSDYLCDPEWKAYLKAEIEKPYFERLCKFLYREITELRMTVYPPLEDVFNVFNMCPLSKIKVVIIGQDPVSVSNHPFNVPVYRTQSSYGGQLFGQKGSQDSSFFGKRISRGSNRRRKV